MKISYILTLALNCYKNWKSILHIGLTLRISSLGQTIHSNVQMTENHCHYIETTFLQLAKSFGAQSAAGSNRFHKCITSS